MSTKSYKKIHKVKYAIYAEGSAWFASDLNYFFNKNKDILKIKKNEINTKLDRNLLNDIFDDIFVDDFKRVDKDSNGHPPFFSNIIYRDDIPTLKKLLKTHDNYVMESFLFWFYFNAPDLDVVYFCSDFNRWKSHEEQRAIERRQKKYEDKLWEEDWEREYDKKYGDYGD
jgi:hypothetical protein